MRIVVRHNEAGLWWWSALADDGRTTAVSMLYESRTDCLRGLAELKVEGPAAPITTEERLAPAPAPARTGLPV